MVNKQHEKAIERERAITVSQLEAKRRVVRDISREIARLERERREAQVMLDYYYDALTRANSASKSRHRRLQAGIDYPTVSALIAHHVKTAAETVTAATRQLLMHADCRLLGRR
jgi:hypothetical protein